MDAREKRLTSPSPIKRGSGWHLKARRQMCGAAKGVAIMRLELNRSVDLTRAVRSFHGWSGASGWCFALGMAGGELERGSCKTHADAIRILFLLVNTADSLLDSRRGMVELPSEGSTEIGSS